MTLFRVSDACFVPVNSTDNHLVEVLAPRVPEL